MTHPLLKPRYMVEAPNKQKGELPYPNSPFRVGQVLEYRNEIRPEFCDYSTGCSVSEHEVKQYSHIFRKMHWSEARELGEMPRWVEARFLTTPRIYSVEYSLIGGYIFIRVVGDESWLDIETACEDWKLTPATESEYLEYLKSKNNESI